MVLILISLYTVFCELQLPIYIKIKKSQRILRLKNTLTPTRQNAILKQNYTVPAKYRGTIHQCGSLLQTMEESWREYDTDL